jgi:predicted RNA-binding protein YlqC (UPF0109 family)
MTPMVRSEEPIRQLILQMVRAVVTTPEEVRVEELVEMDATKYLVYVAQPDMGYAIGKDGRVANAMRTVVKEAAKRSGRKIHLDVRGFLEPTEA